MVLDCASAGSRQVSGPGFRGPGPDSVAVVAKRYLQRNAASTASPNAAIPRTLGTASVGGERISRAPRRCTHAEGFQRAGSMCRPTLPVSRSSASRRTRAGAVAGGWRAPAGMELCWTGVIPSPRTRRLQQSVRCPGTPATPCPQRVRIGGTQQDGVRADRAIGLAQGRRATPVTDCQPGSAASLSPVFRRASHTQARANESDTDANQRASPRPLEINNRPGGRPSRVLPWSLSSPPPSE